MKLMNLINKFLTKFDVAEGGCANAKEVGSKYGYVIVCPEDEHIVEAVSNDPNCENAKRVGSKYGFNIVCLD